MSDTPSESPPKEASEKKVSATKGSPLPFILLVQFILLAGASAYLGWLQLNLKNDLQQLQQENNSARSQATQTVATVSKQVTMLSRELARVNNTNRADWLLAEAEYLLRLANHQALLLRNAPAATTLLNNADKILRELSSPDQIQGYADLGQIKNIRQLIADERAALMLHGEVDREGLYLEIDALIRLLDNIPIVDLKHIEKEGAEIEAEAFPVAQSIGGRMIAGLKKAMKEMGAYVRVQKHGDSITTLLTPSEQLYLKQNLRFMLEQAQIAVLQQNQKIYQNSLDKSEDWINEHFFIDKQLKGKLIKIIKKLKSHNVEKPLPEISESLRAVQVLIRHSSTANQNSPAGIKNQ